MIGNEVVQLYICIQDGRTISLASGYVVHLYAHWCKTSQSLRDDITNTAMLVCELITMVTLLCLEFQAFNGFAGVGNYNYIAVL